MQADVLPRKTAIASVNSGCPPLSTRYTHLSVRMVSGKSPGMLMRDMNSSSSSEDCSRDSSITSGPALDNGSSLAAVVGVLVGGVTEDEWWVEAAGWTGVDWTEVGVAGVGVDMDTVSLAAADVLPSRRARALSRPATCCLTCCGLFLIHLRWLSMLITSVWMGLFRSGVLSRSSSAGGFSSITVSNDVDFPLPAIPTRTTLVMILFEEPRFISSL